MVLEMVCLASEEVPHITNKLPITHQTSFGETENSIFNAFIQVVLGVTYYYKPLL